MEQFVVTACNGIAPSCEPLVEDLRCGEGQIDSTRDSVCECGGRGGDVCPRFLFDTQVSSLWWDAL